MKGKFSQIVLVCCMLLFGLLAATAQAERLTPRQIAAAARDILDSWMEGLWEIRTRD